MDEKGLNGQGKIVATIEKLERKKLCWNCEGNVGRTEANCPYCGVYLHPDESDIDTTEETYTNNIYAPYSTEEKEIVNQVPKAPYAVQEKKQPKEKTYEEQADETDASESWKSVVLPLAFLMAGSLFLLFGVMMFLFAHNGYFTIRWDASQWYIFTLVAFPLLFLGWKTLEK